MSEEAEFRAEFRKRVQEETYLYRIPENESLCYAFKDRNGSYAKTQNIACMECVRICRKENSKNKTAIRPIRRNIQGSKMDRNPCYAHVQGCHPLPFSKAMKKADIVEWKQDEITADEGFPIIRIRKRTVTVLYTFKADETKCYRFTITRKIGDCIGLTCLGCFRAYIEGQKKNVNNGAAKTFKVNRDGLISDPLINHLPGCWPMSTDDVLDSTMPVEPEEIQRIFGQQHSCNQESDDEEHENHVDEDAPTSSKGMNDTTKKKSPMVKKLASWTPRGGVARMDQTTSSGLRRSSRSRSAKKFDDFEVDDEGWQRFVEANDVPVEIKLYNGNQEEENRRKNISIDEEMNETIEYDMLMDEFEMENSFEGHAHSDRSEDTSPMDVEHAEQIGDVLAGNEMQNDNNVDAEQNGNENAGNEMPNNENDDLRPTSASSSNVVLPSDINNPSGDLEPQAVPVLQERLIPIGRKIYTKILQVPGYEEDEIDAKIIDRRVYISCTRAPAVGRISGNLSYDFELPKNVDEDSIDLSYFQYAVTVTAQWK